MTWNVVVSSENPNQIFRLQVYINDDFWKYPSKTLDGYLPGYVKGSISLSLYKLNLIVGDEVKLWAYGNDSNITFTLWRNGQVVKEEKVWSPRAGGCIYRFRIY